MAQDSQIIYSELWNAIKIPKLMKLNAKKAICHGRHFRHDDADRLSSKFTNHKNLLYFSAWHIRSDKVGRKAYLNAWFHIEKKK